MVLKRKLPTAMATGESKKNKKDTGATPASSHAQEKPPLAPKPNMDTASSAIPDVNNTSENQNFAKDLPDNDFSVETSESTQTSASAPVAAWAEEPVETGGWEIDGIGATSNDEDIFGSMADEPESKKDEKSSDVLPPWQQGAKDSTAPELPGDIAAAGPKLNSISGERSGPLGALIGIIMLSAIGFGGYIFFFDKNETTEVISRWTGSLNEVSEEIPTNINQQTTGSTKTDSLLKPESIISMGEKTHAFKAVETEALQPMEDEIGIEENSVKNESSTSPFEIQTTEAEDKTIVEFVEVSESEVEQPLTAEGSSDMPLEVGMIVELQQAINDARKSKNPDNYKEKNVVTEVVSEKDELEMLSPEELDARNRELSRQLDEELAEYRKILSGENSNEPRKITPDEFFGGEQEGSMNDAIVNESGSIPLPQRSSSLLSQEQAESLYGANPYNLPVVPEPSQQKTISVRTLSDFDVSMFQVERERVRIPKNIKPSFRATNFPPIILLSTVQPKGIIAEINSKQGVLLVGESVSGWELVAVKLEYAEFSNGKIKHIVNIGR